MIKFTPKYIGVTQHPIIIVGEKPNKTRDNSTFSLQGNRTGDFVSEAIGDRTNIILTNVVNLLYSGKFDRKTGLADGILELIEMIEKHQPRKIICLGAIAAEYINSIKINIRLIKLPHPSFINRFLSSERDFYVKLLSDEIDK